MKAETQFTNLYDLQQYFNNETVCRDYLEKFRWNGNPVCPFCSYSKAPYRLKDCKTYKCSNKDCGKKFTVTVGTIFENTKIPLSKWFLAMYLVTSHKKGISSLQLGRDIGVTQKTAWFINHRIREMLKDKAPDLLQGFIEVDEAFIGGAEFNKHKNKKIEGDNPARGKTMVVGIIERGGRVITKKVDSTHSWVLQPFVRKHVKDHSTIITDTHYGYLGLDREYHHETVKHTAGEYARGVYHTNTMEGFWSLLSRGIYGIYHSVSPKHIERYLDEFAQRYTTKDETEADRFNFFLSQCNGRLKYKDLIRS